VQQGDILFEMETNKALMEVESPGTGRIRGLASITGEPVAVGTPVAWIDAEGEVGGAAEEKTPSSASVAEQSPVPAPAEAAPRPATIERSAAAGEIRATPLARSTARSHGVDLGSIAGSGPRGRIVGADVEAHLASHAGDATLAAEDQQDARLVPFNATRRTVAQRLAESARTIPHFYLTAQVEMTAVKEALRQHGPRVLAAAGTKPTMTVMLVYLAGRVLVDHPMVNASVEGDAARLHASAHIGVAMDRDGDLVVPVIRDASTRTLAEITREFARLHESVRARSIPPADMRGGTFTISNLGMYGVDAFTAIINPPQSAILAIGRTLDTPVGRDGQVVLRAIATFTLSSDHRIVDGVAAARFMSDLRRAIEDPGPLL
jgi:pyruvate dehydrogenase E2 component (dihydrolipoamide acetyltransferase)